MEEWKNFNHQLKTATVAFTWRLFFSAGNGCWHKPLVPSLSTSWWFDEPVLEFNWTRSWPITNHDVNNDRESQVWYLFLSSNYVACKENRNKSKWIWFSVNSVDSNTLQPPLTSHIQYYWLLTGVHFHSVSITCQQRSLNGRNGKEKPNHSHVEILTITSIIPVHLITQQEGNQCFEEKKITNPC